MSFLTQVATDMSTFFNTDEFGEAATYNGEDITVVEAEESERVTDTPGFVVPLFSIYVKSSDVTRPKDGDSVTFRGVSCVVAPYPSAERGVWLVSLVREVVQA